MICGKLVYNPETDRYEIESMDNLPLDLHAGTPLEVAIRKEWVPTRIEYSWKRSAWYLVGINREDIDGLLVRAEA